jgi:DnaJ-class molecular chaperone
MEYRDYYKILGVPRSASLKDIKAAYRKLARKYHPDVNAGDKRAEARFKEINEANTVLSDPDKRRRYDELGADWDKVQTGARGWPGGGRVRVEVPGFGDQDLGGFSDFFRTFFGGAAPGVEFGAGPEFDAAFGQGSGGEVGDLEYAVDLTLEEVLKGTRRTVEGVGPGSRRVEVKIPAGVRDGSRVRVAGEGRPGRRGHRGDLYLRVRVLPHPSFERQGDDLRATLKVPLTTAVLGGEAELPTLEGRVGIKIPPGTPVGRTFRLRGHGLPRLEAAGARGDLLAELSVELPAQLSKRERELFEELRKLGR